jgi:DNA-binding NtrC family response regulator
LIEPATSLSGNRDLAVLVVDNDALVRLGTVMMLRSQGYAPSSADGAQAALLHIESHGLPDVLVTDYSMPGGTGVDLARQMTILQPDLRVLIVTGHDRIDEEFDLRWLVLRKPFSTSQLISAFSSLC